VKLFPKSVTVLYQCDFQVNRAAGRQEMGAIFECAIRVLKNRYKIVLVADP
jgi:hypothetical protein